MRKDLTYVIDKTEIERRQEEELCNERNGITTYCIKYGKEDCKKTCYYAKEMEAKKYER